MSGRRERVLSTAEQLREEAAEAERLAQRDGIPPKSAAVIHSLKRRWVAFLETHGDEYGFDAAAGPTIELAVTFQTHGYHERLTFSTVDDSGMGDSWGKLAVPYLLARYVFPLMEYAGLTDLRVHELDVLCLPYKKELRANWDRLKVSQVAARSRSRARESREWACAEEGPLAGRAAVRGARCMHGRQGAHQSECHTPGGVWLFVKLTCM